MIKAVVKTIEGEYAVVEMGTTRHKVILAARFLPTGVREGDTLVIDIRRDPDAPRKTRSKVTRLHKRKPDKGNRPG